MMTDHDPLHTCADCGHRIRLDVEQMIRADERERIAQEIDRLADVAKIRWRNEQHVYWEGARYAEAAEAYEIAARIARAGGDALRAGSADD